jgi:2-polyprenyl-6-methoxyphenol hydroxylase-like FAD-dependent oxidoreductase
MKIAIIGCGSTGLAAALFLHRAGHQVTLLEQFVAPRPIGAGLLLQPTGLAVLDALGLSDKILALGQRIDHLFGRTLQGKVIFDLYYRDLMPDCFGLGVQRGALFTVLYEAVVAQHIPIQTSCVVSKTSIEQDKRCLFDAQGQLLGAYDLVVDASGYRSVLRAQAAHMRLNKPYPYGAVWAVCADPDQRFGGHALQQRYSGAQMMTGIMAVGRQPQSHHGAAQPSTPCVTFFWSLRTGDFPQWRSANFTTWRDKIIQDWPEAAPIMMQLHRHADLTFAAYGDVVLQRWDAERLVFIGDAGHSMSPQLGQGANLGLIDAKILHDCLHAKAHLPEALAYYTAQRRGHIRFYQMASRGLTPFFQSDSWLAGIVRDYSFSPLAALPIMRQEMLKVLAGMKTGLFSHRKFF